MPSTDNKDANYPGKGDWWADFLHYRLKALRAMEADGRSADEMARTLNLEGPEHAARILATSAAVDRMVAETPSVADILAGKVKKLPASERPGVSVAYALVTALAANLTEHAKSEGFQQEAENAIIFAEKNLPTETAVLFAKLLAALPVKWGSPALVPVVMKWMTMIRSEGI